MGLGALRFWRENTRFLHPRTLRGGFRDEARPAGPPELPVEVISPLLPRGHHGESVPNWWISVLRGSGAKMPGFSERGHSGWDVETKYGQPEMTGEVVSPLRPRGRRGEKRAKIVDFCIT